MKKNLRDIIAFGLCTFGCGIIRDGHGYGRVAPKAPDSQCKKICDYCQHKAEYLASLIEEESNDCEQPNQSAG